MSRRLNDVTPEEWDRVRKTQAPRNERVQAGDTEPVMFSKWVDLAMQEAHEDEEDVVHNPSHYNTGTIECIMAIEESMTPEGFKGYMKGNVLKYLWRYEYKGKPMQDLQKAMWYLRHLHNAVELDSINLEDED